MLLLNKFFWYFFSPSSIFFESKCSIFTKDKFCYNDKIFHSFLGKSELRKNGTAFRCHLIFGCASLRHYFFYFQSVQEIGTTISNVEFFHCLNGNKSSMWLRRREWSFFYMHVQCSMTPWSYCQTENVIQPKFLAFSDMYVH